MAEKIRRIYRDTTLASFKYSTQANSKRKSDICLREMLSGSMKPTPSSLFFIFYIYMCVYILYIHIYLERERERGLEIYCSVLVSSDQASFPPNYKCFCFSSLNHTPAQN
ncbi:hypothetical protein ACP275_06G017000 [Erythranthe tilingii]